MLILWIILSVICFVYGIMIASLHSGGLFFIFWFVLAAVFALFAVAVRFHWWTLLPKVLKRIFIICVIIGCIFFAAIEGLVISGFRAKSPKDLDYIVVLGAQVHDYGPSVVLKYRLDAAIDYLNENPETVCIVSGAQGFNEPFTEAEGMARYLEQQGIPSDRIIREDLAENTTGNIKYTMEIIEARESLSDSESTSTQTDGETLVNTSSSQDEKITLGIVTNNFHMFRSLHIAKAYTQREGITNVAVSGISSPSRALYLPNNAAREFFGVVKDFVLGNLK
ncbi:MAG: YdcF family protein [Lachnospiraceae bacterium]|nr:YdcF family protein [Lachnospiraceae bacterium]